MAMDEMKSCKAMIRSVLLSCKGGVPADIFLRDYRDVTGEMLPFKKFGYYSLTEFINAIPDVVSVQRYGGDDKYQAVADETTAHIQKLVSKQRSKKSKKPLKRPFRKSTWGSSGYNRPAPSIGYSRAQPSYSSVRRFGHQPRFDLPARPSPLLPTPACTQFQNFNTSESATAKSYMGPETENRNEPTSSLHNLSITVPDAGNKRIVDMQSRGRLYMKAMSSLVTEYQASNSTVIKYGQKFEVPPRFLRQQENLNQNNCRHGNVSLTAATSSYVSSTSVPSKTLSSWTDEDSNVAKIKSYIQKHKLPPLEFNTIGLSGTFTSSISLKERLFGSHDTFPTREEAERAAINNACCTISLEQDTESSSSSSSISDTDIKDFIQQTLENAPNGIWGSRILVLFKERFHEGLPELISKLQSWTDFVEVEILHERSLVKLVPQKPVIWNDVSIEEPEMLTPGVVTAVYVTFALSVNNFYVQREDSCVEDINSTLESQCPNAKPPDIQLLKKGMFCAALFSTDNLWYRAEVKGVENQIVQVQFVDYGNVDSVSVSSIRQLPPITVDSPAQALPCSLYGIVSTDTEDDNIHPPSMKVFSDIVTDSLIDVITIHYNIGGQCEVELKKDELSINQHLVELGLVKSEDDMWMLPESSAEIDVGDPGSVVLPDEKFIDVYVCFISPDLAMTIRIVGKEYSDKLDEFESLLEENYKATPASETLSVGQVCIAFVDELYQRVIVNAIIDDSKIECYYTDHGGDSEPLLVEQVRPLNPAINATLPFQSVQCHLHGLEKVSDTVTALDNMIELTFGKCFVAEIVDREERLSVILHDTTDDTDVNINSAIIKALDAASNKQGRAELSRTGSWGTDEEAEDLAAGYLDSSMSNWDNSILSNSDVVLVDSVSSLSVERDSRELIGTVESKSDTYVNIGPVVYDVSRTTRVVSPSICGSSSVPSRDPSISRYTSGSKDCVDRRNSTDRRDSTDKGYLLTDRRAATDRRRSSDRGDLTDRGDLLTCRRVATDRRDSSDRGDLSDRKDLTDEANTAVSHTLARMDEPTRVDLGGGGDSKGDLIPSQKSEIDFSKLYTWKPSPLPKESSEDCSNPGIPRIVEIPQVGELFEVHVLWADDPSNFWCTPYRMVKPLEDMMTQLNYFFNEETKRNAVTPDDIKVGSLYAGNMDGAWYRVKVTKVIRHQLSIYFVDYGQYRITELINIQLLPTKFFQLPLCAFKAMLYGIRPIHKSLEWSEAGKFKFMELASDNDFWCIICDKNPSSNMASVRLINTSNDDADCLLDDLLIDMHLAERIKM